MQLWALEVVDHRQIEERIKPLGQVRLEKQRISAANSGLVSEKAPTKELSGQTIYDQYCFTCHNDGLAGAPKFRLETDWRPRLDKKTMDELVASAIKGVNAMPAKGTCTTCNELDIKNAIQYMLPQP